MGTRVPRLPVTSAQYEAGLKEGRDLYAEDLARYARNARRTRLAVFLLVVFAGMCAGAIVTMLLIGGIVR